ncbi:MAG: hypothetical protein HZR80_19350 [Candidatus Heimdallarchaeota archaeon]
MLERFFNYYIINNPEPFPKWFWVYFTAQLMLFLAMLAFCSLFIYYLIQLIKLRKINPESKKYFPKVFGFFFGLLLSIAVFVLIGYFPF